MSGILNPKSRIMDTLVTLEGRRQMVSGKFKVEYVTFTDGATFYEADFVSGSSDASNRLFLECSNLPHDQITFEADDSGRLMPFANSTGFSVAGGKIYSGSDNSLTILTGSAFASTSETLLQASLGNFQRLCTLGTIDSIFEDEEFEVSHLSYTFHVTDENPISEKSEQLANINHLESFFQDERFSNIPNFMHLPPINKLLDSSLSPKDPAVRKKFSLGNFPPLGFTSTLSYEKIAADVDRARVKGNVIPLKFDPTNFKNTIGIQVFEVRADELLKLDVLDFGLFKTGDDFSSSKRVLFVGKVYQDDFGSHTFARLFTLVLK